MADVFGSEYEHRLRAVELVGAGVSKAETARRVNRSREWVHKWLRRFEADGEAGLRDRSRAPKRHDQAMPHSVTSRVLEIRADLEDDPVANVGALSILATMERRGSDPLPSISTIERILRRAGKTRHVDSAARSDIKLPLPAVTTPGVWQQADWIQDRYLKGGIRFQSLQIGDVGSHGITSGQYLDRRILTAVGFLIEKAWPKLSIPLAIGTDNAFVGTTHRDNPFTAWTRACLFFGVEVIIAPPGVHGWTNHIEAVNHLWQQRTIWSQHFNNLEELRVGSNRACWWFNHRRPVLNPQECGTRYPAELIAAHRDQLRWPPDMTIADHLNHKQQLTVPLAAGRVTYLRHVTAERTISLARTNWAVPRSVPVGGLVTATITTGNKTLTIGHQGQPAVTYNYPINQPVTNGYYPPAEHSLLHHV
ncbi:MAG: helix-turn-helix domain-containing protein [Acidimicrobiia bacterium]